MRSPARQIWIRDCVVGALRLAICRTRSARWDPIGVRAKKSAAAAITRSEARTVAGAREKRFPRGPPCARDRPLARLSAAHAKAPARSPIHAPRESVAAITMTEVVETTD